MKATLEFNLPDEATEHRWAVQAAELAGAVSFAEDQLRAWLKHGHQFETVEEALEACRGMLSEVVPLAKGE